MTAIDEIQSVLQLHNSGRHAAGVVPRTLVELLANHAEAAISIAGAEQTAWNGQIVEAGEGILGLAHWDGTLHLDRECILDPLREMYSRSGLIQSDATLTRYREALVTMLHEQSHFLGRSAATQEAAREAFKQPGSRALEEGVAEAWAHAHLDDYLTALGVDQVAPGIDQVQAQPSYQAFVPAVTLLTDDLDERAGLPAGETLRALNRETAEGQWPLVVDLVYCSSGLAECVPPNREPVVRLRLENTLRESFRSLEDFEGHPRGYEAARSKSTARQCIDRLNTEIQTAERYFQASATTPDQATALRSALSGLAPPKTPTQPRPTATPDPEVANRTRQRIQPTPTPTRG